MRAGGVGRILAVLVGLGSAAVAMASGCGTVDGYGCHEAMTCDIITEDGINNGGCRGICVDADASGFETQPRIVWIGPAAERPSCADALLDDEGRVDDSVLTEYEHLVAEPDWDMRCEPCACTEPACVFPAGLTVTSGWMCDQGPGETVTPFRAPPGWDGSCVAPGAVAPEVFGSFEVAPVTTRPCEVVVAPVPRNGALPDEGQSAVICKGGVADGPCPYPKLCMIGAPYLRPGFRHCIVSTIEGDHVQCPSGRDDPARVFSERFTFWKVYDTRQCTPCACTETAPSTCEAIVSTFEDEACTDLLDSTAIRQRVCHDADLGSALGSMRAEWRVNAPGSCAPSGGELVGELVVERRTLCCIPEGT